jgi:glutamate-1-semialdehyde 2,1-aminomutase
VAGLSSMFQIYLTDREVWNYEDAKTADTEKFLAYFHTLLNKGVFIPPSQFECCFISLMHSNEDIEQTLDIIDNGMKTIKKF